MVTISLCMIVKNEEKILKRCLDSVRDLVDEIIIVDTGSSDSTKSIASEYTDKIYDFKWVDDFSTARNFAFSKATCDYIYSADADEVIDAENQKAFLQLKEALIPEVEIVQMYYDETDAISTVLNEEKELRPKLFKRNRSFTWIDPIHETVRTDPVVFDSDIVIQHRPESNHSGRDFSVFEKAYARDGILSERILRMYLTELYRFGNIDQITSALPVLQEILRKPVEENNEFYLMASTLLLRYDRLKKDFSSFLKNSLHILVLTGGIPNSEFCCEMGLYFEEIGDTDEALVWFENAKSETEPLMDVKSKTEIPIDAIQRVSKK